MKAGLTDVPVARVLSCVKALGHFHGLKGRMIIRRRHYMIEARRTAFTNRGCSVVGDLYKSCKLSTSWQSMHFRIPGCQKVL
jgi:hypothetical protein